MSHLITDAEWEEYQALKTLVSPPKVVETPFEETAPVGEPEVPGAGS